MSRPFLTLDPRARLLTVVAATAVISSTPAGALRPFAGYGALLALLWATGRPALRPLLARCVAASPFFLLAAAMLLLRDPDAPEAAFRAGSVALKGLLAAALLAYLGATTALPDLLWSLSRLGVPAPFTLLLTLMSRYVSVLSEEYLRLERARQSRTVRPLGAARWPVFGRQLGTLLLRALDRGDRIYAAMASRGFTGAWPTSPRRPWRLADSGFLLLSLALLLLVRCAG